MHLLRYTLIHTTLALTLLSCASHQVHEAARGPASTGSRDLPWEISGEEGESYLPDIFYAEAAQNEQIMPTTMANGRHQIDRLIYPTIGNPHLFVRDKGKAMVFVLRIEPNALAALNPQFAAISGTNMTEVTFNPTPGQDLAFYLINRQARNANTAKASPVALGTRGIFKLKPKSVVRLSPSGNMPKPFQQRITLKVSFDGDALRDVPEGLYDIRFELLAAGQIQTQQNQKFYEYQYNSVRVFNTVPGKYGILNVTDTQVSAGAMKSRTYTKMREFVDYVNASTDPEIANAAFITFNGDLHNGGSPEVLLPSAVATTYNQEARLILDALKDLKFPIFLTVGNHDGYVAMGHTAEPNTMEPALQAAIDRVDKEWPGYNWSTFQQYLRDTDNTKGGRHVDIFEGQYVRRESQSWDSYVPVDPQKRNMVLYDGFNQWRRTYGPLYTAWTFGDTFYVNLNTYNLRQHRRSGWGIYTVNYGGGISPVQQMWMHKMLGRAQSENKDIVVLAHHDPRGGHKGKDFPFYFEQIDFSGFGQSAQNYVQGEILNPFACKKVPGWMMSEDMSLGCLHDGLQEWMRADEEFDCENVLRKSDGTCDTSQMAVATNDPRRYHPAYSGYAFLDMLANTPNLRTLLLGHTHYYAADILQEGDELVPGSVVLDAESRRKFASQDVVNPLRGFARAILGRPPGPPPKEYRPEDLRANGIEASNDRFVLHFNSASGHTFKRVITGHARELAILRLTSAANLTSQKFQSNANFGFTLFEIYPINDSRRYPLAQINRVKTYINEDGQFLPSSDFMMNRTLRMYHDKDQNFFNQTFAF